MPPKNDKSKKEVKKIQKQVVDDKTFGLKNKNKSKVSRALSASLRQHCYLNPPCATDICHSASSLSFTITLLAYHSSESCVLFEADCCPSAEQLESQG